ncbi:O-antigen ligase [Synechococcus sp. PCC 7336]|uniref:O-antigen ligase family protein n=1 Tax=Synechococcus sp. PCC 7336 TaxID=195250 RepID=UPI00037916CF|nr:O-antigen ligase family protein [Synechococcus sp. PCC 7336]
MLAHEGDRPMKAAEGAGSSLAVSPLRILLNVWEQRDEWLLAAMVLLPVSLLGSGLLLVVGSGLAIVAAGWKRDRRFDRALMIVAAVLLGVTAAAGTGKSWLGLANYLPFMGGFALVSQVLRSRRQIRRFLLALVAGSWGFSIFGWGQVMWGWSFRFVTWGSLIHVKLVGIHAPRPTSVFENPNGLAILLLMVLAIAWGLWCDRDEGSEGGRDRWVEQVILAGAMGLGGPLLVLTESRNGWLVALLALGSVLVLMRRWRWVALLGVVAMVPVGAAANLLGLRWIVPSFVWQRLLASLDPNSVAFESMVSRWDGWVFAFQMWRERPLTGWGWQSFADRWAAQVPPPEVPLFHAHNIYLSLAAEGGLLALGAFGLVWGWTLWRGWQAWRWERRAGAGGFLLLGVNVALGAYFVAGLLDAAFFDGRLNVMVWMVLAVANSYWRWLKGGGDRAELTK